jgi:SAM-dependent methyltransferase
VRHDDLPDSEFDLVHLRLVLAWLAEPFAALERLVRALRPGGWLVAEEMDFVSLVPDPRMAADSGALFARVAGAHDAVLTDQHSFDPSYGRRLAGDLADAGLVDLGSEGRVSMWHGAQTGGRVWRLTLEQLREPMVASGRVTESDVDAAIALCDDPSLSLMSQITMAAWGRRQPET